MTRINLIPPQELMDLHLLAEYRELPRVFPLVEAAQEKGLTPQDIKIPQTFCLGTGHVLFFYNKLIFLMNRQRSLVEEMLRRGYAPNFVEPMNLRFSNILAHWWNDWIPSQEEIAISRARIEQRRQEYEARG